MWPHRWQPTSLPCPWDSPGKNTGLPFSSIHKSEKWKWSHSVMSDSSRPHELGYAIYFEPPYGLAWHFAYSECFWIARKTNSNYLKFLVFFLCDVFKHYTKNTATEANFRERNRNTHTPAHTSTQEGLMSVTQPAIQQDFEALSLSLSRSSYLEFWMWTVA